MIQCRITDAFTRRILPLSVAAPRHNIIISHTRSLCALHSAAATGCREVELRVRACRFRTPIAGVAELADALDSKSSGRKVVWVRAPPPAMNSQFDGGSLALDGDRITVGAHLEKNASRPIRKDHQLCCRDTSSAHLPVSLRSRLDWDRRR